MTENEMRRMQEEAYRRTLEMQRRANAVRFSSGEEIGEQRNTVGQTEPSTGQRDAAADHNQPVRKASPAEESAHERDERKIEQPVTEVFMGHPSGGIFEAVFKDKEKTLILGLILLLMDEKTDNALLMALMYLLI